MTDIPNKESTSNKQRSESERKSTKEPIFKEIDVVKQYTRQVFDHFDVNQQGRLDNPQFRKVLLSC